MTLGSTIDELLPWTGMDSEKRVLASVAKGYGLLDSKVNMQCQKDRITVGFVVSPLRRLLYTACPMTRELSKQ